MKYMQNISTEMTKSATSEPNTLSQNDESIADPIKIANIFNNFPKTKNLDTFFFTSPDIKEGIAATKEEICSKIPSLNPNETTGPFSIAMKVLKLLRKDISSHLNVVFNLSVTAGLFPTNLKFARVVPVHRKESKLNFSNYRPISLLSNLDKIFEKLMHNRLTDACFHSFDQLSCCRQVA